MDLVELAKTFGFQALMVVWLLYRTDSRLDKIAAASAAADAARGERDKKLAVAVTVLAEAVDRLADLKPAERVAVSAYTNDESPR